jgi:ribosomal protein S18 acetylase RimI-like enzyme
VFKTRRTEFYELKFEKLVRSKEYLPTSLVAVTGDGVVAGFVMGEFFIGEFGITQDKATLDTLGVDPDYQKLGIGERLMNEFAEHLKSLGVWKINTLVEWDDRRLVHFFSVNSFRPSLTINLEREL